jgi:hypothetical protein
MVFFSIGGGNLSLYHTDTYSMTMLSMIGTLDLSLLPRHCGCESPASLDLMDDAAKLLGCPL